MNLIELTTPPAASFPVRVLSDHLRLGTGFVDDGTEDPVIEAYLRAAMATIEGRIGKALLSRDYSWDLTRWACADQQGLPIAPVSAVTEIAVIMSNGTETVIDPSTYRLVKDGQRPRIEAVGGLPTIPFHGHARLSFTAGYGPTWDSVPADLQQAVLMLAGYYYDNRGEVAGSGGYLPFGVLSLIERYRVIRTLGDAL